MVNSITQTLSIRIQSYMSELGKKRQRIYDLLKAKTKPKFLCLPYTKQRKIFSLLATIFMASIKPNP